MVVLKNKSEIIADRATYITIIISSFTIIISLIFMIYLLNKIIKSIRDLNNKMRNISEGNYSQQLNILEKMRLLLWLKNLILWLQNCRHMSF